jgi:hypothetical protein
MKRIQGRAVWNAALTLMGGAGIASFVSGYAFPVYSDYPRASALKRDACNEQGVIPGWYEQINALETLRHPLMQGGLSLLLASITLLALGQIFAGEGRLGLRTPAKRITFFVLGVGVLVLSWFAQIVSLGIDQNRGAFPSCADTIGIPIAALTGFFMIIAVACVMVGAGLAYVFGELPQPLGNWRKDRPAASLAISLPFALIGLAILVVGVLDAAGSTFIGTPAAIVALYLVEATRSGLLARLKVKAQPA